MMGYFTFVEGENLAASVARSVQSSHPPTICYFAFTG